MKTLPLAAPTLSLSRDDVLIKGYMALFCLLWSSAFVASKIALQHCPPLTLLTIRFFTAALLMLGVAWLNGGLRRPSSKELRQLILLGLLNHALYLGLTWSGITTVSSAFAAILVSTNPLLIGALAGPLLGERVSWQKWMGLLLGLGGVMIVLQSRLTILHEDLSGILLILGGVAALVTSTLLYKHRPPSVDKWLSIGVQFLAGSLALLPFAWHYEADLPINLTPPLFWSMTYIIVAVSMGGYYLWFTILTRFSATTASTLNFCVPPLGLLFGWIILEEPMTVFDLIGVIPITLSIWLMTRTPRVTI